MNSLKTLVNGGHPFDLDDLRFQFNAIADALKDIVRGLHMGSESGLILWGAEVTNNGNNYDISEGAIFIGGEICHVPAHSLVKFGSGGSGTYYWDVEVSYDASGTETFQNGAVVQTYEVRVAKLKKTSQALQQGTYLPLSLPKLSDHWEPNTDPTAWTEITKGTGVTGNAYYRLRNGNLEFKGQLITSATTTAWGFILPVGFRPLEGREWFCVHPDPNNQPDYADWAGKSVKYNLTKGQLNMPAGDGLIISFDSIPPVPLE